MAAGTRSRRFFCRAGVGGVVGVGNNMPYPCVEDPEDLVSTALNSVPVLESKFAGCGSTSSEQ